MHYQAAVVQSLYEFFQPGQADELRAQALDKLARLSEQSQMNLREMIQQQRVSRIDFSVDRVTVEIPFKAHNSKQVGEPEQLRDRSWLLTAGGLNLRSLESTSADDIYEKFAVSLTGVGLKLGKRDYPQPLEVVEELDVSLMIKVKSKLRSMLRKDEDKEAESPAAASNPGCRAEPRGEPEPEVQVTTLDGRSLPDLRLNLTPDAYNALVNIYSVLSPEKTRAEITR